MKTLSHNSIIALLLLISQLLQAQGSRHEVIKAKDANGYTYKEVSNDPSQTRIYTLDNGLKVYLSINRDEPKIRTSIAVRAGSAYDPPNTTGLAHYLEHLMFKGTSKIGTQDWEKEKIMLNRISELYQKHLETDDAAFKSQIYKQIDSLSYEAAQLAVPNEFAVMMKQIGADVNAYTGKKQTVYVSTIPANQLEKWAYLEKERFSDLVIRIFHTELEAVYEEFNMTQDKDGMKAYIANLGALFPTHPYGTLTLGKAEHLKNPSIENIMDFWRTYYVPNNMAVCLTGDLDYEETIKIVDKYFGQLEPRELPEPYSPEEEPINSVKEVEVYGPDAESVSLTFRFPGYKKSEEHYIIEMLDAVLQNGHVGLIDVNLNQKQKTLGAGSSFMLYEDYGMFSLNGKPRDGQSLEEVKDLLLAELEKVKKGEFEEWVLDAVLKNFKLSQIQTYSNGGHAYLVNAFLDQRSWEDQLNYAEKLEKVSKEDIINYANEHFNDNYVILYKRTGSADEMVKVEKPPITPLKFNEEARSDFYDEFNKLPDPEPIEPKFVDFDAHIQKATTDQGLDFYSIENKENDLFSLYFITEMGKNHMLKLPLAMSYLKYLGTDKYTNEELKKEWYKNAMSYNISVGGERTTISLSGLNETFEEGLKLLEHVLANAQPDQEALDNMVNDILKSRENAKKNMNTIFRTAMIQWAQYGENSPHRYELTNEELKQVTAEELLALVREFFSYQHMLFYYGSQDPGQIMGIIEKHHEVPSEFKQIPGPVEFEEREIAENEVFFVDYDMVQAQVFLLARDVKYDLQLFPLAKMYDDYYGMGHSAVIFHEIREKQALGYVAASRYAPPAKRDESFYVKALVGTQADKLEQATNSLMQLLNSDLPKDMAKFDMIKNAMLTDLRGQRIVKSGIFWTWLGNKKLGYDYDYRKDLYQLYQEMEYEDFEAFFNEHIKGQKYAFLVIGSKEAIDMEALKKHGKFTELSMDQLFNY